jgi:hypothetical protein
VSRLSRFLHLERARAEPRSDAEPSASTADRFEGVQRPSRGPEAPRSSGADLDRFGPEPPPRIELLETSSGAQPFTRCMRCGMDHGVFATVCTGCNASLDTPQQRDFNERLWARRQEEAAREAAVSAELRAEQERARGELARARRAMGEDLAREVGERERARLRLGGEGISWGGTWTSGSIGAPLGLRLLRALPDWRWQVGAVLAAVAVVGGLAAVGLRGHPGALLAAILVGILLAAPNWRMGDP